MSSVSKPSTPTNQLEVLPSHDIKSQSDSELEVTKKPSTGSDVVENQKDGIDIAAEKTVSKVVFNRKNEMESLEKRCF